MAAVLGRAGATGGYRLVYRCGQDVQLRERRGTGEVQPFGRGQEHGAGVCGRRESAVSTVTGK